MKNWTYGLGVVLFVSLPVMAEDMAPASPVGASQATSASSVEIVQSALGSGLDRETRTIQGEAARFDGSTAEVYFLTRVKSADVPTTITHVYSLDGNEEGSVSLSIKGSPWTTWSRKVVRPGAWKIEVEDASGQVIKTMEFTVSKIVAVETPPIQP